MMEKFGYQSRELTPIDQEQLKIDVELSRKIDYYESEFDNYVILPVETKGNLSNPDLRRTPQDFHTIDFLNNLVLSSCKNDITFENCYFFGDIIAENCGFDGKIRFRNCKFFGKVNFRNAKFKDLADFWSCDFYTPITFYKTDFMGMAVFSSATFYQNVLFTYSLFDRVVIFRGTAFKQGLDLSLAITTGTLSVFDIQLRDFTSTTLHLNKEDYEKSVSDRHKIPINNKRETYRILKSYYESNDNNVESLPYKAFEKKTLLKENCYRLFQRELDGVPWWRYPTNKFLRIVNIVLLFLNWISNGFGIRLLQSFVFTIGIAALFFYLMIMNTGIYSFDWNLDWSIVKENIPKFLEFVLPTHKISFMGDSFMEENKNTIENGFYIFDFVGRIFIGYGIYQIIQTSRKFK
jgi:hypothetical protein